jgi:hypothetical protein
METIETMETIGDHFPGKLAQILLTRNFPREWSLWSPMVSIMRVEEVTVSNWQRNEEQAARILGLATTKEKSEPGKVRQLDIELSDGSRIVLAILSSGGLSLQSFRECPHGKPLWHSMAQRWLSLIIHTSGQTHCMRRHGGNPG